MNLPDTRKVTKKNSKAKKSQNSKAKKGAAMANPMFADVGETAEEEDDGAMD